MMGSGGDRANGAVTGLSVLAMFFVVFGVSGVLSSGLNSTLDSFNITPDTIYLNWSNNYIINVTVGKSPNIGYGFNVTADNTTTGITGNYSQRDVFPGGYTKYWTESSGCFYRNGQTFMTISGGYYSNLTDFNVIAPQNESDTNLVFDLVCPPGRYWGTINLTNTTNPSDLTDYVNLTFQIDVPITTENELNGETGVGRFGGFMPANADAYHYFYFNTSNVTNATAVTINLLWSNTVNDLDLFLFDLSGNMLAKSIESNSNESLYYANLPQDLPQTDMWEIRIYGNLSTQEEYSGIIYYSTLNATKDYNESNLAGTLDFGGMNAGTRTEKNMTLKNSGGTELVSVEESVELYHVEQLSNISGESQNFTFVLPSTATKLRASVNWSGASDYNITLYNPNGIVMGTATNKSAIANKIGAVQEEFIERTSGLAEGVWTVNVKNNTAVMMDAFNVVVKFWVTTGNWIATNYSTVNINSSGLVNDSRVIHLNLTVQNATTSGVYEGFLKYLANSGTIFRVPLKVNVTVPVLVANDTLESFGVVLEDNIGFSKTRTFNVTIKNLGNANLATITTANSSDGLSYGSNRINFTFQYPSSLDAYASSQMNVTLEINTEDTNNANGLYTGWIYLNATDSRPYQGVNVSITFNLSNQLSVVVSQVTAPNGINQIDTANESTNITIQFRVYYLNGTEINDIPNLGNFSVILEETNVSYYIVPEAGNLTISNGSEGGLYDGGSYYLNATVPANRVGGRFYVNVTATYSENDEGFIGEGAYSSVGINRSGLYLTMSRMSLTITEGTTSGTFLNMSAKNYGIVAATGRIGLDSTDDRDDCAYVTFTRPDDDDPDYDDDGGSLDFDDQEWNDIKIDGNGSVGWYRWRFSAANSSSDKVCTLKVNSTNPLFNNKTFTITVNAIEGSDDDDTTVSGSGDDTTNVYNYSVLITNYPEVFNVVLGESNSSNITVKNTGNISTEVKVSVSINDGITATVSPDSYYIPSGKRRNFTVTFDVSDTSTLGEHSGSFKAYVTLNTDKYDTESFTFNVLSTATREQEINDSYTNYSLIFEDLLGNFTNIKLTGLLSEDNLTAVGILINDTLQMLQDIKDAIDSGDYATAESLLAEMNSNINRVKAGLVNLDAEKQKAAVIATGGLWMWAVVGVVIAAVAGLFVYMMLPVESRFKPKQPSISFGRKPWSKSKPLKDRIKDAFRRLFKRKKESKVKTTIKKYAGGYNKHNPVEYKFKKK